MLLVMDFDNTTTPMIAGLGCGVGDGESVGKKSRALKYLDLITSDLLPGGLFRCWRSSRIGRSSVISY